MDDDDREWCGFAEDAVTVLKLLLDAIGSSRGLVATISRPLRAGLARMTFGEPFGELARRSRSPGRRATLGSGPGRHNGSV